MEDETAEKIYRFMLFALACAVGMIVGYQLGHDRGVRDCHAGNYTVVQMPDGTQQTCEVKK